MEQQKQKEPRELTYAEEHAAKQLIEPIGLELVLGAKPVSRSATEAPWQRFVVTKAYSPYADLKESLATEFAISVGRQAILGSYHEYEGPAGKALSFEGYRERFGHLPGNKHGMQLVYPEDRPPRVYHVSRGVIKNIIADAWYWLIYPED